MSSTETVASLTPDIGRLAEVAPREGVNCVAGDGDKWKSRMFGPGLGVAGDLVTIVITAEHPRMESGFPKEPGFPFACRESSG